MAPGRAHPHDSDTRFVNAKCCSKSLMYTELTPNFICFSGGLFGTSMSHESSSTHKKEIYNGFSVEDYLQAPQWADAPQALRPLRSQRRLA